MGTIWVREGGEARMGDGYYRGTGWKGEGKGETTGETLGGQRKDMHFQILGEEAVKSVRIQQIPLELDD